MTTRHRPVLCQDSEKPTDWDDAMRQLRERQDAVDDDMPEAAPPESQQPAAAPPESQQPAAAPPDSQPPAGFRYPSDVGEPTSGFRFDSPGDEQKYVAGLDSRDEQLLRNATLIGGRLLTAITLFSLVFYIYVGLSGGITDGFDRYTEPIEDIRTTMAREDPRFAQ